MRTEYRENGGIVARGEGIVTGSELKRLNDEIYESPDKIRRIAYQICDLSHVSEISISNSEVEELALQDKYASEFNPNMLIVLVGSDDLVFGLSRMWEAYADDSPFETMVFRNVEDAHQWIEETLQSRL